jgi:hypothetical protein
MKSTRSVFFDIAKQVIQLNGRAKVIDTTFPATPSSCRRGLPSRRGIASLRSEAILWDFSRALGVTGEIGAGA